MALDVTKTESMGLLECWVVPDLPTYSIWGMHVSLVSQSHLSSHHITSHRAQHPHHDLLKKIQGNYQISTGLLGDPRVPCATWKTNAHGLALGDSKYICWGLVSLRLCNGAMEQYQTSWVQKRAGRMLGISVNIAPRHGSLV